MNLTGEDFGFDIASWHEYLSRTDAHGYTRVYSYERVLEIVEATLNDMNFLKKRSSLIETLDEESDW